MDRTWRGVPRHWSRPGSRPRFTNDYWNHHQQTFRAPNGPRSFIYPPPRNFHPPHNNMQSGHQFPPPNNQGNFWGMPPRQFGPRYNGDFFSNAVPYPNQASITPKQENKQGKDTIPQEEGTIKDKEAQKGSSGAEVAKTVSDTVPQKQGGKGKKTKKRISGAEEPRTVNATNPQTEKEAEKAIPGAEEPRTVNATNPQTEKEAEKAIPGAEEPASRKRKVPPKKAKAPSKILKKAAEKSPIASVKARSSKLPNGHIWPDQHTRRRVPVHSMTKEEILKRLSTLDACCYRQMVESPGKQLLMNILTNLHRKKVRMQRTQMRFSKFTVQAVQPLPPAAHSDGFKALQNLTKDDLDHLPKNALEQLVNFIMEDSKRNKGNFESDSHSSSAELLPPVTIEVQCDEFGEFAVITDGDQNNQKPEVPSVQDVGSQVLQNSPCTLPKEENVAPFLPDIRKDYSHDSLNECPTENAFLEQDCSASFSSTNAPECSQQIQSSNAPDELCTQKENYVDIQQCSSMDNQAIESDSQVEERAYQVKERNPEEELNNIQASNDFGVPMVREPETWESSSFHINASEYSFAPSPIPVIQLENFPSEFIQDENQQLLESFERADMAVEESDLQEMTGNPEKEKGDLPIIPRAWSENVESNQVEWSQSSHDGEVMERTSFQEHVDVSERNLALEAFQPIQPADIPDECDRATSEKDTQQVTMGDHIQNGMENDCQEEVNAVSSNSAAMASLFEEVETHSQNHDDICGINLVPGSQPIQPADIPDECDRATSEEDTQQVTVGDHIQNGMEEEVNAASSNSAAMASHFEEVESHSQNHDICGIYLVPGSPPIQPADDECPQATSPYNIQPITMDSGIQNGMENDTQEQERDIQALRSDLEDEPVSDCPATLARMSSIQEESNIQEVDTSSGSESDSDMTELGPWSAFNLMDNESWPEGSDDTTTTQSSDELQNKLKKVERELKKGTALRKDIIRELARRSGNDWNDKENQSSSEIILAVPVHVRQKNNNQNATPTIVTFPSPERKRIQAHAAAVLDIKVVYPFMFTASEDCSVCCYHCDTNEVVCVYDGHESPVSSLLLDIPTPNECQPLRLDNGKVFTGCLDKKLRQFDAVTGDSITVVDVDREVWCIDFNWGYIFMGLSEGRLASYNLETHSLDHFPYTCKSTTQPILGLKALTDADRGVLIVAQRYSGISMIDAFTGFELMAFTQSQPVNSTNCMLIDEHFVYCSTISKTLDSGDISIRGDGSWEYSNAVKGAGFTNAMVLWKQFILCASQYGYIYIYKKGGEFVAKFPGAGKMLRSITIANGKVYSGSEDGCVEIQGLLSIPELQCLKSAEYF